MKPILSILSLSLALCVVPAQAKVALNSLFADGMVLQREVPVPIWGTAEPNESVTVEFAGQSKTVAADAKGNWSVRLDALPANEKAQVLIVKSSSSSQQFQDVLVGDVWLASGQSNMGYPISSLPNASDVLAKADDPLLRFFTVTKKVAAEPQSMLQGKWEASNSTTTGGFSAVAYYFAREIRRTQNIPVAVLNASWGGTPIQTWIALAGIQRDPPLAKQLNEWEKALADYEKLKSNPQLASDYENELRLWKQEVEPAFGAAMKEYNAAKAAGQTVGEKPKPARPEPTNPDPMGMPSPSRRPQTPTVSFNGMIAPLAPYALRGAIWYQGEADGGRGIEYRTLFPRLIESWRAYWQQGDFPFLFVQLPGNGPDADPVAKSGWPFLREAQLQTLKTNNTAMAIAIDVGNPKDVHPANKEHVGMRLALAARKNVYKENVVASGPIYQDLNIADGKARLRFREIGSGLTIGQSPWYAAGVEPWPTDKLIGFFVAGEDKQWVEASATIEGDSVIVSSPAVPQPVAVRYGWANSPRCNLYNKEGLPASPFRTDDWP